MLKMSPGCGATALAPKSFRETSVNLYPNQVTRPPDADRIRGPSKLVSTEKFLVPYVLEGEVPAYNQRMLERFEIRSPLLFFCVEAGIAGWRSFDWRTRHTGLSICELLVSLIGPLF